ncbi:glycosyltransferase family 2 protein [Bifidobacterium vansinderenii]|uniref:Glycosyl transferase family 2 n=1 Tax=Bifidobacterium vansinderenii TaxID=1984871 RepID=A0A229W050_9BIFI|nr:glycosyltransferase family 2 protein [Bifidobacterium vansinderenii]OXN01196.1 glycosyl transferase family 2 [Bifidobacterium vansinderenii]
MTDNVQPKVSIIVPVYKAERFLGDCLNSLTGQSHRNLQIILVDDASPDSCPQLCDEWARKDDRVLAVHLTKGAGASGARNAGLERADGDYVMFVDSDDLLDADAVEFSVDMAVRCHCDLVIFGKRYIDENGQQLRDSVIENDIEIAAGSSDYYSQLSVLLREDYLNPPWGKLFSRKLVEGLRFETDMVYEEDLLFVLAALERQPNVYTSKRPLYGYRHMDSGMATVFKREKSLNVVKANHAKLDFFERHLDDPHVRENLSFNMANDIGWVIPMIQRATGISAALKAQYVMEMTGDARLRPMVTSALGHAWMTRVQKLLIALNQAWLWRAYLK